MKSQFALNAALWFRAAEEWQLFGEAEETIWQSFGKNKHLLSWKSKQQGQLRHLVAGFLLKGFPPIMLF